MNQVGLIEIIDISLASETLSYALVTKIDHLSVLNIIFVLKSMGPHQFQYACLFQLINNCFTLFKKAVLICWPFPEFFSKRLLLTFAMRWP